MTTWTSGYVADIGYTFGYYTELNPLRLGLAFAQQGLVVARRTVTKYRQMLKIEAVERRRRHAVA